MAKINRRNIQKDPNDPDNHNCVITHLELDILECEVGWVLGSITTNKASGDDGIPTELFQVIKDDAVKVLHSICQQIWKTQQCPQDWKSQFSFQSKENQCQRMFKLLNNCIHLTHSKIILKIIQARLQQYVNQELPNIQAGFRKGRGTSDQIANIVGSYKKHESSRKTSNSALLTTPKPLTVWIRTNYAKF